MAIQKNAGQGSGRYIREAGEYRAKIAEIKTGLSKKGKPMLTVLFETPDEKSISGYFVKTLDFHMKALAALKVACGLKATDVADNLVGKECGIAVEGQEPTDDGKVFFQITGYGPVSDLSGAAAKQGESKPADDADYIPF